MRAKNITAHITKIAFPDELLPSVRRLNDLILECINEKGVPVDSGFFDLDSDQIDESLDLALFYIRWISSVNEVINNLNIVLEDLISLPSKYFLFPGLPDDRYYLLLRTYFHEFYRFREIHNRIVKESAMRGIIKKSQVDSHRKEFHTAFKEAIELRNTLVHATPIWTGKQHFNLALHGMAVKNGFGLKDVKTGEMCDIKNALEDACEHVFVILQDEGHRMSVIVQKLVNWHLQVANSKPSS